MLVRQMLEIYDLLLHRPVERRSQRYCVSAALRM